MGGNFAYFPPIMGGGSRQTSSSFSGSGGDVDGGQRNCGVEAPQAKILRYFIIFLKENRISEVKNVKNSACGALEDHSNQ